MEKKKLLLFTQHYGNDVYGQILEDLTVGLQEWFDVSVICSVPYVLGKVAPEYKTKKYYYEDFCGVKVCRVAAPEYDKTNKLSRVKNILVHFFRSRKAARKMGKQDYCIALSNPPILGGMLGVYGKRATKSKLIYLVHDWCPESVLAINYAKKGLLTKLMRIFDNRSLKKSDLVITVGRDLVDTLKNRFKNKKIPPHAMITNWSDGNKIYPLSSDNEGVVRFKKQHNLEDKFVIMYSGNIGLYYDLENIIKVIQKFPEGTKTANGKDVVFMFIGEGAKLHVLKDYVQQNNMSNVYFAPFQIYDDLIYSLNSADVHWCINAMGFKGVSCPSKYYGIAAVGKPVIAVLEKGTEVRSIIEETRGGLVCSPADYESIEKNIQWFLDNVDSNELLQMGKRSRENFDKNLSMEKSIEKYKECILSIKN